MSLIERILWWTGILALVIAIIGVKIDISKLEQKAQQVTQAASEGGEE